MTQSNQPPGHIVLTSHPRARGPKPRPIMWAAADPVARGPVIGTLTELHQRNVIGAHNGAYGLFRALAVAAGTLSPVHKPDLADTHPAAPIGPHPQWTEPGKIVALDPWGHVAAEVFTDEIHAGVDVRPTIAVTRAFLHVPELKHALATGRLRADGQILKADGEAACTKVAIDPVWYLPGVAERCGIDEGLLRRTLFSHSGGMFPELVTRDDLHVFLPPIGGATVYIFGDLEAITDPQRPVACRVHDECNGSDVFGSDICTCRPYLTHGIEVCIETAQAGGCGIIIYNRKEGRGLGEVTKFLVYNARKRQQGGDTAANYFARTECVAGVQDVRFQELMPDVLHWLGVTRIDRFVSMSDMKYEPLVRQGIDIGERVAIPDTLIPADARVEMDAKKAAGYWSPETPADAIDVTATQGRGWEDGH